MLCGNSSFSVVSSALFTALFRSYVRRPRWSDAENPLHLSASPIQMIAFGQFIKKNTPWCLAPPTAVLGSWLHRKIAFGQFIKKNTAALGHLLQLPNSPEIAFGQFIKKNYRTMCTEEFWCMLVHF